MSTDRETTRIVQSWLEEGVTALPDRVLDTVLDQLPATPQRRSWWPSRRSNSMNTYVKLFAAAAAVLVVAVASYQFLPGTGGVGGGPTIAPSPSQPTNTPSPSQALLARGTFKALFGGIYTVDLDATGAASSVTGSMTVSNTTKGGYTQDLECTRTINGLLWIGGDVTESTHSDAPVGTRAAIVLSRGSPGKAIFVWQMNDPRSDSCQAFFDDMVAGGGISEADLGPIEGTVEFGP